MHETLLKIKTIMENNLTMDAWDTFTIILKENQLQELLNQIYMHKNLAVAKANEMKSIILQTAEVWKNKKPSEHGEIINQIIESINHWYVKNE